MIKKILIVIVGLAISGALSAFVMLKYTFPKVSAAEELKVELSEKQVERGRYLAQSVAVCMDCHSQRDWTKFSGPMVVGTEGQGGELFSEKFGFPGNFYSRNITPHKLSNWTDGEILRAFTSGVSKDGTPFFPVMPYLYYGKLAKEDAMAIVAYLRTLKPISNDPPPSEAFFPMSLIMRTIPKQAEFVTMPSPTDKIAYGKYVTNAAACFECHTKQDDKGNKLQGLEFAGGFEFNMGSGISRSANITPDPETGIGNMSREFFINRFKSMSSESAKNMPLKPEDMQTPMPWTMYADMTEEDLGAIYDYLFTQKAIKNPIVKWTKNP